MSFVLQPWQLLFAILSGWIHHRQQQIIEFQNDQIQSLLKQLGKKRIILTDDQRRILAVKGKALGRKFSDEIAAATNGLAKSELYRLNLITARRQFGAFFTDEETARFAAARLFSL